MLDRLKVEEFPDLGVFLDMLRYNCGRRSEHQPANIARARSDQCYFDEEAQGEWIQIGLT